MTDLLAALVDIRPVDSSDGRRNKRHTTSPADRSLSLGGSTRVPYPEPTSAATTAVMRGNRSRDTRPEVRLRSELHRRGLRFRKDFPLRAGGRTIRVDIVFTRRRLAVFVDGCFWHGCPDHGRSPRSNKEYWTAKLARNAERDSSTNEALAAAGWHVLRLWEHDSPDAAASAVESKLQALAR